MFTYLCSIKLMRRCIPIHEHDQHTRNGQTCSIILMNNYENDESSFMCKNPNYKCYLQTAKTLYDMHEFSTHQIAVLGQNSVRRRILYMRMNLWFFTYTIRAFRRTKRFPSRPDPAPCCASRAPHRSPFSPWTFCC